MPEPNTETDREIKTAHTITIAAGHLRAHPETVSVESAKEDQDPLETWAGFVYTRKPTSGFFFLLNGEPINIRTKKQALTA